MRVIVIGGTGHIGTWLIPKLVEAGYSVVNVSRGGSRPYHPHTAWRRVQQVTLDREAEERSGHFGDRIRELEPDIVVDLICFTVESARQLVDALRHGVQHFLHCGSIWIHGPSVQVPTVEEEARDPFGDYGVRKLAIEQYLLAEARRRHFPATVLHPGHIVGPGWAPVNPAGNLNLDVFSALAQGRELVLPNLGMETLHHVHAEDVAQVFFLAITQRGAAVGESFHVVSPAALTLRGYAERMAAWFGAEPNLRFLPWDEWRRTASERDAALTWDHIAHSPNCSIAKAARRLGFQPRYGSLRAVQEAVAWLIREGRVTAAHATVNHV